MCKSCLELYCPAVIPQDTRLNTSPFFFFFFFFFDGGGGVEDWRCIINVKYQLVANVRVLPSRAISDAGY